MNLKIIGIILLVVGEAPSIYIELSLARKPTNIFGMTIIFIAATPFLLYGYIISYSAFRNIWIVSVISITSILIIEPILAYLIFRELPTRGASIGLIFGTLGFISSLL